MLRVRKGGSKKDVFLCIERIYNNLDKQREAEDCREKIEVAPRWMILMA